jgi:hypothetical protein
MSIIYLVKKNIIYDRNGIHHLNLYLYINAINNNNPLICSERNIIFFINHISNAQNLYLIPYKFIIDELLFDFLFRSFEYLPI